MSTDTMDEAAMASRQSSIEEDGDDEELFQVPVYINRGELADVEFNCLQFMTRPFYRAFGDQGELDSVHQRPIQKTFKLVYEIQKNENYNEDHIAELMTDDTETANEMRSVLTSRNLTNPPNAKMFGCTATDRRRDNQSSSTSSGQYALALGALRNGSLFITPKLQMHQVRPDVASAHREFLDSSRPPVEEDKENENKPPGSSPQSAVGKAGAVDRLAMTNYALWHHQEDEPWEEIVDRHQVDSMQAKSMLRKLTKVPTIGNDAKAEAIIRFSTDWTAFLKSLTNEQTKDEQQTVSLGELAELSPVEQVEHIVHKMHVVSWDELRDRVSNDMKDEELMDKLLEMCDVVHGHFVIKSPLCIAKQVSDVTVPAGIDKEGFIAYMGCVRDICMTGFSATVVNNDGKKFCKGFNPLSLIQKAPSFRPFKAVGPTGDAFKKALLLILNPISTRNDQNWFFKKSINEKMLNIDKVEAAAKLIHGRDVRQLLNEELVAKMQALKAKN